MNLKDLKKITIIAILIFLLIGFAFFRKDTPKIDKPVENPVENSNLGSAEKEKVETLAKNFSNIYYSYTLNDPSNIESLYPFMTEKMKTEEKDEVEKIKSQSAPSPKKYLSAIASPSEVRIISFIDPKIHLSLSLRIENIAGAMTKKDPIVWVDENGTIYRENPKSLVTSKEIKYIQMILIRKGDQWQVDSMEIISSN